MSKKAKHARQTKDLAGSPTPTCSRFWVILLETPGEHDKSKSAIGPFQSYAAAEKWIIDDARSTYADSSPDLRAYNADTWGEAAAIVEERRRIRPVPTAKISVRLVDLSSENTKDHPPQVG